MLWQSTAPKMVFFAITSHCDLSCTTCRFPQIPVDERKHVDYDASRKAIDMLAENDVRLISLTGGEPLLHPRFLDICRHVDSRGLMISYIATNGLLLDDRIARELSGLNINIVGLSMDIMDENGVGRTRSYNVRKVVRRAKEVLDRHGIKCYAGVLPGRSPEDVSVLLDQCREMGFSKVIFSYPQCRMSSSYRAAAVSVDTDIDSHQMREVVHAIKEEKKATTKLGIFNTDVNLDEFLKVHGGKDSSYGCPAGERQFYLDWNLDLYRCFNDGMLFGNILDLGNLDFDCESCQKCTQQAFRDYASFYRAYDFLDGLRKGFISGDGKKLRVLLSDGDNYRAMRSLMEAYLGGFV
ncbi:MAG: radical SAM protein [Thermoplasmata archaeon]